MDLTLAVHFPHRRYHATPWDQAANSGAVEWPPSPWRLARALLSVWHTRKPELEQAVVERLVRVFGGPADYLAPISSSGHTRHYLPLLDHKCDSSGGTSLTLDAYVGVSPNDALQITWRDADLSAEDLAVAAELWSLLPYLGRAESICRAELSEGLPRSTQEQPWRPDPGGDHRLMCMSPQATLAQLEMTPTAMRKARSLMPGGAEWVAYRMGDQPMRSATQSTIDPVVHAARWRLVAAAPFPETLGIWATDRLRWLTLRASKSGDDPAAVALHGHDGSSAHTFHGHAHWLWTCPEAVGSPGGSARRVQDLIVWIPDGVASSLLTAMIGKRLTAPDWAPRGYVEADLALVGFGGREVLKDLGAKSRTARWTSATPFLMTRQMKPKRDFRKLLAEDLSCELQYRFGATAPQVIGLEIHQDRRTEAMSLRQQRIGRGAGSSRPGGQGSGRPQSKPSEALYLTVELDHEVTGPLLLGRQSHFGFGRFSPVP